MDAEVLLNVFKVIPVTLPEGRLCPCCSLQGHVALQCSWRPVCPPHLFVHQKHLLHSK